MKTSWPLLLLLLFSNKFSFSQAGMWTWISGSNTIGNTGVFGTQGVPSVNNHPPGLYEFADWKDKQGNFWVYGGWSPAMSDLWKYDPLTNEWTWVKGPGVGYQMPVYGTLGVPDPANNPGKRTDATSTWVDTSGNLWLYGGDFIHDDMWKFDIGTNEWTWMQGSTVLNNSGSHGVLGVPSPTNSPGSRRETCSNWTDDQNNLWLFGGNGYDDAGILGDMNDMMKYDISTNEWTWMRGSALSVVTGSYGIKGVPNVTNDPSSRLTYTKWKDLQGNFWMMGGGSISISAEYNDVWKFDPGTNIWTWMAGPNTINDAGVYLSNCVYDTLQYPSERHEHRSSATDNCGRFWLFGGHRQNVQSGFLNDLWVFDPQLLQWNFVNGSNLTNQPGNYGTLGVAAPTNEPPSRAGALAWWGNDNRFYIFGGSQNWTLDGYSDLWVFNPDSFCTGNCSTVPVALFSSPNTICPGTCTNFSNLSMNSSSFQWFFPGALPNLSTDPNPSNICYNTPGNYDVTLIAAGAGGIDTLTLANYITVYPQPPPQGISQIGDTLFANAGASSYQWYFNGNIINGATEYFYVASSDGDYSVVATDADSCQVEAVVSGVITSLEKIDGTNISIYPNPVEDKLMIHDARCTIKTAVSISIYNTLGEVVWAVPLPTANCKLPTCSIDVSSLNSGIYFLQVNSDSKTLRIKFVKE